MEEAAILAGPSEEERVRLLRATRRKLRDYANVGLGLLPQRIILYTAASILAGAYYSWKLAFIFYALVCICEIYDIYVFRSIINRRVWEPANVRKSIVGIYCGTTLSSVAVSLFAISFALQQGHETGHFMPLFMLISASIFATMNNYQFMPVLALRLSIYVSAIILIPVYDVWRMSAPISSELWLHLFTVLFVLGFLFELARSFLNSYSKSTESRLQLEEEHERTKVAYKAKAEFLSTVSHELRTPLTSIKGPLEIINSGALGTVPEKMRIPLNIAARNTKRLLSLVDDLLLLQRAEAGKLDLQIEVVDIGRLILDIVERFRPYAENTNVSIEVDAVPEKYWARCDQNRIDQVLTNLLSNAAKFSNQAGAITIALGEFDGRIRASVTDQGIGIPEGSESKIFEAFGQIDSSDTRKFQGTGLGLSISKKIIEAHGGIISYISLLGEGSTFLVDLQGTSVVPIGK